MSLIIKSAFALLWGQLGTLGRSALCFAISILIARSLGSEQYGIYAMLLSYVLMLVRFTEMGSETVINTYLPKYQAQSHAAKAAFLIRKIIFYRFTLVTILSLTIYFATSWSALSGQLPFDQQYLPLLLSWFIIRSLMDCLLYVIWAELDMKFYAQTEILVSILQLVGVVLLSGYGINLMLLITLMLMINGMQLLAYFLRSRRLLCAPGLAFDTSLISRFAITLWISTILHFFISKGVDIIMIGYFNADSRLAAFYDIAYLLIMTGACALLTAFDSIKLPILSEAYVRYGIDGLRQSWRLLSQLSIYLACPALAFFSLHAQQLIVLCYGAEYLAAAPLLQSMALFTLAGLLLGNEVSPIVLFPLNKERLYLYLHGSQGLLNLLLNFLLIPKYGAFGAVLATGSARVLLGVVELLVAQHLLRSRLPWDYIIKISLAMLLALVVSELLPADNLLALILNALIYALLITWFIGRLHNFRESERALLRQLKPQWYKTLMKFKLI